MDVLPMDAGEEVVEAEEESQLVNSLPSPDMPTQSERDARYCALPVPVLVRALRRGQRHRDGASSR